MTDVVDMRKLMEAVGNAETQQVDEVGGVIDKTLAALGGKSAGKRVDFKKEQKHIKQGWKDWEGDRKVSDPAFKKNDPKSFKEFLAYWEFSGEEIDQIAAEPLDIKKALPIAAKIQFLSKKGVTGEKRGGPVKKPTGDDYDAIMTYYVKTLGGNSAMLKAEMVEAGRNPKGLDVLGMLGFAFMDANGKGSKDIKGKVTK